MPEIDIDKKRGKKSKQHISRAFNALFYKSAKNNLEAITVPIGVDKDGNDYYIDLVENLHILAVGSALSGVGMFKRVVLKSIIDQFDANQCKLVLIDSIKSLRDYSDLPHLIHPIAEKDKDIKKILNWLNLEMERRFNLLVKKKKKDLLSYNIKYNGEMPFIVVVVTELGSIMNKENETNILKTMQMAKAVGIYFILTTQIPDKTVVSGSIKANCPIKIAFQLPDSGHSRLVIDEEGAEGLLGQGDMLFRSFSDDKSNRFQGYYFEQI